MAGLIYDEALRPTGLRGTQFTLLQALSFAGPVTQGRLGSVLAVDSTTLSRTLAPVERNGWIQSTVGEDRRERYLELTEEGRRVLGAALPYWHQAQDRLRERLGDATWALLFSTADSIAGALAS